ncbi:hypothetical protein Tsubulata_001408 [Turnera subulata]|uniref:NECAP PHear domain-containing protein n=1 Tax=Turnera subulata TaxID=218843 RepID=A0A9Q0FDH2_9ROSI|nr:hypothetical protein Tsubulata_001408 [Turnera subulata]
MVESAADGVMQGPVRDLARGSELMELFPMCFVKPSQRENSVETVLDSSRYFVLKIKDGSGYCVGKCRQCKLQLGCTDPSIMGFGSSSVRRVKW